MKFNKYIKPLPALSLIMMLLCAGIFLSSCEDEEPISEDVVLESFGPSGVKHGEQIKFIGLNLDKVSGIVLQGAGEIPSADFDSQSASLIELTVPKTATAGRVILKTPKGDLESKAMLSFEVPVEIESITAEARPGADITIKGKMVNWIEEVTFEGGAVVTEFVSSSLNELVLTVPMEAQTGFLIFASGGTDPLSFVSEEELIVTLPAVTELSPAAVKHSENLTIKGTDLDLVTSIVLPGIEEEIVEFESQSATAIVVTVPTGTVKGTITLQQISAVDVVTTQELMIVLPVGTELAPKPAVPGVDDITISGTNLDLVAELILPGIETPVPAADFASHTAEEIVVALPAEATAGAVKYTTIHGYTNNLGVNVVLPGPGPEPLDITLYDDEILFGGSDGSWNGESDIANTEQAYAGTVSWKFATTGDGGAKAVDMSGVDASGMAEFVFSLYGGEGTDGKNVAAILVTDDADVWGSYNAVPVVAGEWTEYKIELSKYDAANLENVNGFIFKLEGAEAGEVIYIDRVGFSAGGPPPPAPLDYFIYNDGLENGWSELDGWGHEVKDFQNSEEVFNGEKAIKVTYNGEWGAIQIGSPSADVFEGFTTLSFRIYAPVAQDFIVQIGENADVYLSTEAGWNEIEVAIADIEGNADVGELRFKNNNGNLPVTLYFDYIGLKY